MCCAIFATAALCLISTAYAGDHGEGITLNTPDKLEWKDGPPSLPKGAKIAVLEGNPAKDGPFVFRVKVPDGYRIPPHTHPKMERVTAISGTFNIGMGDKFDLSATSAMPAGSYGFWEPGMKHFVWTKGETDSNFGFNLPWWDYLLGTYRPQPAEDHATMPIGVAEFHDERVCSWLPAMLWLPFRQTRLED